MRANFVVVFLCLNLCSVWGEENVTDAVLPALELCSLCTCSEIPDVEGTHLVLNVQCSELDRTEELTDLDKISWPDNPNALKIAATFEGLGISTLGKLPPNSQVETLRFTNNIIQTYWPDPFSDVPSLKHLSFSQNDLSILTPDLFTNIESLEDLDLSYNKLSEFNPLDFKSLHRVRRLNLQNNVIKKIPIDALNPMTMLEDLDLSKNGIFDLLLRRSESKVIKGLRRLNLNGNRIRSVSMDSFPANNSIELLDLSNNIIEIVELNAFLACTNLRELNLAHNNITFSFTLPPYVQIVILKANTMYNWLEFPKGITYIDMSYNRLSNMYDENSVYFENLEILNVAGNQIKEYNIKKQLPKLFSLDLSYNLFVEVPSDLSSQVLPNLEELRLDGSPLEHIFFKNILTLRNLYMNDLVKLTVVENKAFSNVQGKGNEESGDSKKICFYLYLSNCPGLSDIQSGAFDGTSLCMLDISKNNLSSLSSELLEWSSVGGGVNLQWNPWDCACSLQWMLDQLLPAMYHTHSLLLAELRCGSPREFAGLRLVHFYNWTEQVMCSHQHNYMLSPSTATKQPAVTNLTIILVSGILVGLFLAVALFVYLVKTKRRYRIRQAAMKRKRQSAMDARNGNSTQKEQYSALNRHV